MNSKATFAAATAGAVLTLFAGAPAPQVSDVRMSQNAQGVAKIRYTLSAAAVVTVDIQTNATVNGETTWASVGGAAVSSATGDVWKKVESGEHTIRWDGTGVWADGKIPTCGVRAAVRAWSPDNTPDYMAVDISAGAAQNTQTYYPDADFVPGGVTNDAYKTSMLLMRKIMAKGVAWTMGSMLESQRTAAREQAHLVTLTNNYYIGVYAVTQAQWQEVAGYNNSFFTKERSMRPVENVGYNEIRLYRHSGSDTPPAATAEQIADYSWPNEPNPDSFLGRLNARTGLCFDMPSDAQWEFAARAGNGDTRWGDGSAVKNTDADENLDVLGRYGKSTATAAVLPGTGGTAIVGSYEPNDWGLYDMHGNAWELCLDWFDANENIATATDTSGEPFGGRVNIDPADPAKRLSGADGIFRVMRGGAYNKKAGSNRSAYRSYAGPATRNASGNPVGVRVVCTAGLK